MLGDYSPARIADGVTVGETLVGGMTGEQARTAVRASFRQPIAVGLPAQTFFVSPSRLGVPLIAPAIEKALVAAPGEPVALQVLVDRPRLVAYSEELARDFSRPAVDAQVRLRRLRPVISEEKVGLEVHAKPLARALEAALLAGTRGPIEVRHTTLIPEVMKSDIRSVIVIQRSANRLFLYREKHKRTKLGVATGQPSYPTPLGEFTIVSKQPNPWWYPPDSDWAAGLSRAGWASRLREWGSTARRMRHQSATRPRTAVFACASLTRNGSSSTCPKARRSLSFPRCGRAFRRASRARSSSSSRSSSSTKRS
jgi:hypothetical protein